MSKNTKKQMKSAKRKSNKASVPTENDKATPPTATHNDDEIFHSDKILEWANNCGVTDTVLQGMLSSQLLFSYKNSAEALEVFQDGILAMHQGIKPKDTIESLLAAQMVATHNMAMEFSKRVMLVGQTVEGVDANINRATKLMRTYVAQVEALRKYRTGGKQTIQVQHVNVNEGGQAVIGNIQGGGVDG